MRFKTGILSVLLLTTLMIMSYNVPEGWVKAGSQPDKYDMGTDPGAGRKGGNAATIKSIGKDIKGSGTLMQNIAADNYKEKRIRLTGYVKATDVAGWAGLWLRVDGKNVKLPLAFDDMSNRPIKGTCDWTKCKVVLDVPKNAVNIAYGGILNGMGQIWFDNLKFDVVGSNVPTTDKTVVPKAPTNLNFKK